MQRLLMACPVVLVLERIAAECTFEDTLWVVHFGASYSALPGFGGLTATLRL